MPVLAKLVEMRAISMGPRAHLGRNEVQCAVFRAVPLHVLQAVPEPPGDIFSDRLTRAEETHFRVEGDE
jgi:hypothetical protein